MSLKDPELRREYQQRWSAANRERMNAASRRWNSRNRAYRRPNCQEYRRELERKCRYGLAKGEFQQLLLAQDGKCALCQKKRRLCVDHDHRTKKVRGLLCHGCNTALGAFGDAAPLLFKAIDYLWQHEG